MKQKQHYAQTDRIFTDDGNHQTSTENLKQTCSKPDCKYTSAMPTLLYSNENWTLKKQVKSRNTDAETKFLRKTVKYTTFDHKINQNIFKYLKKTTIFGTSQQL